ncbi:hypothetical protein MJO29_005156 [Puccinia striiformis f. sp. tritici]|nr:hypothetical protein MJO29_005156 [Puccinia striiformis f. sp. tritici]
MTPKATSNLDPVLLQLTQDIIENNAGIIENRENQETGEGNEEEEDEVDKLNAEICVELENKIIEDCLDTLDKLDDEFVDDRFVDYEANEKNRNEDKYLNTVEGVEKTQKFARDEENEKGNKKIESENEKIENENEKSIESDEAHQQLYEFPTPANGVYEDPKIMKKAVKEFAVPHGYVIVQKRSTKGKSIIFKCDR